MVLSEASLTEIMFPPLYLREKERSKIIWKRQDLRGTAAIGDIFSFGGGLDFMSFHLTSLQTPSFTRSRASDRQATAAFVALAETWAPCWMAASKLLTVQFGPQSTGQPLDAYSSNCLAAGWRKA